MKTPRDERYAELLLGNGHVVVAQGNVRVWNPRGDAVTFARNTFDEIVDWYIGADAIRAYVAKHEREDWLRRYAYADAVGMDSRYRRIRRGKDVANGQ